VPCFELDRLSYVPMSEILVYTVLSSGCYRVFSSSLLHYCNSHVAEKQAEASWRLNVLTSEWRTPPRPMQIGMLHFGKL